MGCSWGWMRLLAALLLAAAGAAAQQAQNPDLVDTSSYQRCVCPVDAPARPDGTPAACYCVHYDRCDPVSQTVKTTAEGVLTERAGTIADSCPDVEVCCRGPDDVDMDEEPGGDLPQGGENPPEEPQGDDTSPERPQGDETPPGRPGEDGTPRRPDRPQDDDGSRGQQQMALQRPPEAGRENADSCGLLAPGSNLTSRLGGGAPLPFGDYPWLAAVLVQPDVFRCGAVLLGLSAVLTAAHCVQMHPPEQLLVSAGEWDAAEGAQPEPVQQRAVRRVLIHPAFNPGSLAGDVALLLLERPLRPGAGVRALCLPPPGSPPDAFAGRRCQVAGWGKDSPGGDYSAVPRRLDLPVMGRSECQRRLRRTHLGRFFLLDASFVCAGGEREGADACLGDGGGPLACPGPSPDAPWLLAGLVSWGIGCGAADLPGVYADVAWAEPWVTEQLRGEGLEGEARP